MPNLRKQKALGVLIEEARRKMDLSRRAAAKRIGVSENSMLRYEHAGVHPDGQYPPANKLAAIVIALEIPPGQALWSSLSASDFKRFEWGQHDPDYGDHLANHPTMLHLQAEYSHLLKENDIFRRAMRFLIDVGAKAEPEDHEVEIWHLLVGEMKANFSRVEHYNARMEAIGFSLGGYYEDNIISSPKDAFFNRSDHHIPVDELKGHIIRYNDRSDLEARYRHHQKTLSMLDEAIKALDENPQTAKPASPPKKRRKKKAPASRKTSQGPSRKKGAKRV